VVIRENAFVVLCIFFVIPAKAGIQTASNNCPLSPCGRGQGEGKRRVFL
jgi:hypothetical protein